MVKTIEEHHVKLQTGSSNQQYIVFKSVKSSDLEEIEKNRSLIGKGTRLSYDEDLKELVVKLMPSVIHGIAHVELARSFDRKVVQMGLGEELVGVGAGKFKGKGKSKEGDSALKPFSRPGEKGWPTIVIESGLSESLSGLRSDAAFWLNNSGGDVNIVILIAILSGRREYTVEKWESIQQIPVCVQEIKVHLDRSSVKGGPLLLNFQKIFLHPRVREPIGQETDILFSDEELLKWEERVWTSGPGNPSIGILFDTSILCIEYPTTLGTGIKFFSDFTYQSGMSNKAFTYQGR